MNFPANPPVVTRAAMDLPITPVPLPAAFGQRMRARKTFAALIRLLAVCLLFTVLNPLRAQNDSADNPTGSAGGFNGYVTTGGCYDPYTGNAKRVVTDLVVPGSVGAYPLAFTRTFNSNFEPTSFDFPCLGDGVVWRHSYQWTISPAEYSNGQVTAYDLAYPDGSVVTYQQPGSTPADPSGYWRGPAGTSDRLEIQPGQTGTGEKTSYVLHTKDGGQVVFARGYVPTSIVDPNGATTTLTYGGYPSTYPSESLPPGLTPGGYLLQVIEPGGRSLSFNYGPYVKGPYIWPLLNSVWASTGQSVTYNYGFVGGFKTRSGQTAPYPVLQSVTYNNESSTSGNSNTGGNSNANGNNNPVTASYTVTANPKDLPQLSDATDPHYAGAMTSIQYAYNVTATGFTLAEQNDGSNVGEPVSNVSITDSTSAGAPTVSIETRGDKDSRSQNQAPITRTFTYGGSNANAQTPSNAAAYQISSVTDFQGNTSYYNYDAQGYVAGVQDFAQNKTAYGNEPVTGKVTSVLMPDGTTRSAAWTNKADQAAPDQPYYLYSTTDERNHTTFYKHNTTNGSTNGLGLVTEIDYPDGGSETFTYQPFSYTIPFTHTTNTFYKVSQHVTRLGAVIYYYYDGNNWGASGVGTPSSWGGSGHVGLLTTVVRTYNDANGHQHSEGTQLAYDTSDRLASVTDPRGTTDVYVYSARHQLVSITHAADGTSINYAYDDFGRQTSVQDELGHTTSIVSDEYGRPKSVTQPVNAKYGSVTQRTTYTTYDGRDNQSNVVADALSHTSNQFSYQVLPSGRGVQHIYSPNGWVTDEYKGQTTGTPGSPGLYFSTCLQTAKNTQYDPMGRLVRSTDAQNNNWLCGYDSCGRRTSSTDPLGHQVVTAYYEPADAQPVPSCYGLVHTVQTPGNNALPTLTTTYTAYDAMGRATGWTDDRNSFSSTYDVAGDTTGQSDGMPTSQHPLTGYSYDQLGRKTKITYADARTEQWSYDASGNVSTYQNRAGVTQTLSAYDSRNRPTGWTWSDGVTPSSAVAFDAAGRCTGMNNGSSALTMTYDDSNALQSEQQAIDGADSTATVTYMPDADGNVINVSYPSGDAASWANNLDYLGRPAEADAILVKTGTAIAGSSGIKSLCTYAYAGTLLQSQLSSTGILSTYGYQANNRINAVSLTHQGTGTNGSPTNISSRNYGYYPDGQLSWYNKSSSQSGGAFENGLGNAYYYWTNGMLTNVAHEAQNVPSSSNFQVDNPPGAASNPTSTEGFNYDAAGNLLTYQIVPPQNGSSSYSFNYNGENQCSASSYDANGNVTSLPVPAGGAYTYSYNALNQLTTVTQGTSTVVASFVYDPKGRLCQRTINDGIGNVTTRLYYAGSQVVEERDGSNNKICTYYYGVGGARVARVDESNAQGFYHYDGQGRLTHVSDGNGNILEQYFYSAFGVPSIYDGSGQPPSGQVSPQVSTALGGNRALWAAGYEWYPEIGLYLCGARFYSPGLGRFMQTDPIGQKGGLNIYGYCQNDPINGSDPTGLDGSSNDLPTNNQGTSTPITNLPLDMQWAFGSTGLDSYNPGDSTSSALNPGSSSGSTGNSILDSAMNAVAKEGTLPNLLDSSESNTDTDVDYIVWRNGPNSSPEFWQRFLDAFNLDWNSDAFRELWSYMMSSSREFSIGPSYMNYPGGGLTSIAGGAVSIQLSSNFTWNDLAHESQHAVDYANSFRVLDPAGIGVNNPGDPMGPSGTIWSRSGIEDRGTRAGNIIGTQLLNGGWLPVFQPYQTNSMGQTLPEYLKH